MLSLRLFVSLLNSISIKSSHVYVWHNGRPDLRWFLCIWLWSKLISHLELNLCRFCVCIWQCKVVLLLFFTSLRKLWSVVTVTSSNTIRYFQSTSESKPEIVSPTQNKTLLNPKLYVSIIDRVHDQFTCIQNWTTLTENCFSVTLHWEVPMSGTHVVYITCVDEHKILKISSYTIQIII